MLNKFAVISGPNASGLHDVRPQDQLLQHKGNVVTAATADCRRRRRHVRAARRWLHVLYRRIGICDRQLA